MHGHSGFGVKDLAASESKPRVRIKFTCWVWGLVWRAAFPKADDPEQDPYARLEGQTDDEEEEEVMEEMQQDFEEDAEQIAPDDAERAAEASAHAGQEAAVAAAQEAVVGEATLNPCP